MTVAQDLRLIVTFERFQGEPDGGGGVTNPTWTFLAKAWGAFYPERSRERIEAGRLESAVAGTIAVRSTNASRGVTAADRAVIGGVPYAIKGITNPDRRNKFLEMSVERGTAT